jgi:YjbR
MNSKPQSKKEATVPMGAKDFRRIALSLEGAEEGSHMGAVDFRVGGRIFATLAHEKQGYGNLLLTAEQQAAFVEELPEVFLPVHGGWGKNGATHIVLGTASEDVLEGALRTAWKLRQEKNAKSRTKTGAAKRGRGAKNISQK